MSSLTLKQLRNSLAQCHLENNSTTKIMLDADSSYWLTHALTVIKNQQVRFKIHEKVSVEEITLAIQLLNMVRADALLQTEKSQRGAGGEDKSSNTKSSEDG